MICCLYIISLIWWSRSILIHWICCFMFLRERDGFDGKYTVCEKALYCICICWFWIELKQIFTFSIKSIEMLLYKANVVVITNHVYLFKNCFSSSFFFELYIYSINFLYIKEKPSVCLTLSLSWFPKTLPLACFYILQPWKALS